MKGIDLVLAALLRPAFPGFTQSASPTTPEQIHALVQEVLRHPHAMAAQLADYPSRVTTFTRWYDRNGKLSSFNIETFDHSPAHPKSNRHSH